MHRAAAVPYPHFTRGTIVLWPGHSLQVIVRRSDGPQYKVRLITMSLERDSEGKLSDVLNVHAPWMLQAVPSPRPEDVQTARMIESTQPWVTRKRSIVARP